ncbi:MAG: hypothetical protein U0800_04610 [Isosphaeraceae bacterium]
MKAAMGWTFAILLGSYAYFDQARDWNSASRLMLTYAMGDRGTIRLDGLDRQTGDIAFFEGHYYTDKLPGYSMLALPPYLVSKAVLGFPPHPLNAEGQRRGPADPWVTLSVSGTSTAMLGALLAGFALRLGCSPRVALLIGLAFGLATPAFAYATMAYGHPVTSCCLFGGFLLLLGDVRSARCAVAGFLAALAVATELQSAPVAALLGGFLGLRVLRNQAGWIHLLAFAIGAAVPTGGLVAYNLAAFGKPWEMGYFHHATPRFAGVHSPDNPLGLNRPDLGKAVPLLFSPYRGLLYYAPILFLAVPGWIMLGWSRRWEVLGVTLLACLATFFVNLSYPEWTGGWSTGPRLLVPLLPFAMAPVAALLARGGRWALVPAVFLAIAGGVLMLMFVGVGARIPDLIDRRPLDDPLRSVVWPLWSGLPLPRWWIGERFTRTLASSWGDSPRIFLPLVAAQALAILLGTATLPGRASKAPHPSESI